jgi:hypothetical protein
LTCSRGVTEEVLGSVPSGVLRGEPIWRVVEEDGAPGVLLAREMVFPVFSNEDSVLPSKSPPFHSGDAWPTQRLRGEGCLARCG